MFTNLRQMLSNWHYWASLLTLELYLFFCCATLGILPLCCHLWVQRLLYCKATEAHFNAKICELIHKALILLSFGACSKTYTPALCRVRQESHNKERRSDKFEMNGQNWAKKWRVKQISIPWNSKPTLPSFSVQNNDGFIPVHWVLVENSNHVLIKH